MIGIFLCYFGCGFVGGLDCLLTYGVMFDFDYLDCLRLTLLMFVIGLALLVLVRSCLMRELWHLLWVIVLVYFDFVMCFLFILCVSFVYSIVDVDFGRCCCLFGVS